MLPAYLQLPVGVFCNSLFRGFAVDSSRLAERSETRPPHPSRKAAPPTRSSEGNWMPAPHTRRSNPLYKRQICLLVSCLATENLICRVLRYDATEGYPHSITGKHRYYLLPFPYHLR